MPDPGRSEREAPAAPRADVRLVVPAKRLSEAKSRLRHLLDDKAREALVLAMLTHVIRTALAARRAAGVAVITSDPRIAAEASACGARVIPDEGRALNASLEAAVRRPWLAAAEACMVLPGDLPDLTPEAVDRLLAMIEAPGQMAVASDQHGLGTSALAWRGERFDAFRFGAGSFAAHQQAGRAAGFAVAARAHDPAFFDVDDPEGLSRVSGRRALRPALVTPQPEPEAHA